MHHINLVYITNENYAMPTGISMLSLLENKAESTEVIFHIIASNVSDEHKSRWHMIVGDKAKLQVIDVNEDFYIKLNEKNLSKTEYVTPTALFKFEIPTIFNNVDKALYMDCDLIVNKDLTSLWETDISDVYAAVINDMGDTKIKSGESLLAKRIGMNNNDYFNSGVMLLNLKKMRSENVSDRLLEYRRDGINYFMDQDALNIVFESSKKILPYIYNFRTPIFEIMEFNEINEHFFGNKYKSLKDCLADQYIFHMTDALKPWIYWIPWFSEIFLKYYEMSPYREERLELKSPLPKIYKSQKEANNRMKAKMEWRFPWEKVPANSRIILYGAGKVGTSFAQRLKVCHYCSVVRWVDRNYEIMENVSSPEEINRTEYDFVLIAILNEELVKESRSYLLSIGVKSEKIIIL